MQALGVKFYSKHIEIKKHINGKLLGDITSYDTKSFDQKIKGISFDIVTDVKNPLLGTHGAAHTYAMQKGATKLIVKTLERYTEKFCLLTEQKTKKKYQMLDGSGAAGGVGFGVRLFLDAHIYHGIDYMIHLLDMKKDMMQADLIIVGEGKLDMQTLEGKAPYGIAALAKSMHKRVIGLFGMKDSLVELNFLDEVYTIVPTYANFQDSIDHPQKYMLKMLKDIKLKK